MIQPIQLAPLSLGVGDRFGRQAPAQLQACIDAARLGVPITPVWNKSNREHNLIGSEPAHVRAAAEAAVRAAGWTQPFFVDADHIGLKTVDRFLAVSDFFTIDVADFIGAPSDAAAVAAFAGRHPELTGRIDIAGIEPFQTTRADVEDIARRYLGAVREAGAVFRHIEPAKGAGRFVTEVSLDETDRPQTPFEMLVILAGLADEGVPAQTVAPKFTGRFNKGVDYVGDLARFEREFNDDLCVLAHAVTRYGLPASLKLSVHSGSDKFSLYPIMRRALVRHRAGVHLKTAGTTWLEEVIGLAETGGPALALAKEIYVQALGRIDELCAPYATVVDIDRAKLPTVATVNGWTPEEFASALRHEPGHPRFNPSLRQLIHVAFKIAAEVGGRYRDQLDACAGPIARNVTANLFERHIRPLFLDGPAVTPTSRSRS